jgi:outer membrane biosynthesis protein TonB
LKLLTSLVSWRWTPCVALIASSLLYVLIVVLVTPTTLSFGGSPAFGGSPKGVNVIEGPPTTNAMGAPRTPPDRQREAAAQPPGVMMVAPVAPQPPTPAPAPVEEIHRPEPLPPPPPEPEPAPAEADEHTQAPPPPVVNTKDRVLAAPLRMMPQISATVTPVTGPPPSE